MKSIKCCKLLDTIDLNADIDIKVQLQGKMSVGTFVTSLTSASSISKETPKEVSTFNQPIGINMSMTSLSFGQMEKEA